MIKQALKRFLDEGVTRRDWLALAILATPGIVIAIGYNVAEWLIP
jgi:hypothetical protein